MRNTILMLTAVLMLAVLCGGCNKFTRANYDTIYTGMPSNEVKLTLGEPTWEQSPTLWKYINDTPWYMAIITFDEKGKVAGKTWSDEKHIADHPEGDRPESKMPAAGPTREIKRTQAVVE